MKRPQMSDYDDLIFAEGDFRSFEYRGYYCQIMRNPWYRYLSGLIRIDKDTDLFDRDDAPAHGGLVFEGEYPPYEGYFVGIICGGWGDLRDNEEYPTMNIQREYRSMRYVMKNLKGVADYIIESKADNKITSDV